MTLLVCRTCPRYDAVDTGGFRRALDARLARNPALDAQAVRHVQCLGGCPEDGVAAVDGPGKARVRFTGLSAEHADALVAAACAHAASATGAPDEWDVPGELVDKISAVTHKRGPVGPTHHYFTAVQARPHDQSSVRRTRPSPTATNTS
jgi:predicted metal-binding protein